MNYQSYATYYRDMVGLHPSLGDTEENAHFIEGDWTELLEGLTTHGRQDPLFVLESFDEKLETNNGPVTSRLNCAFSLIRSVESGQRRAEVFHQLGEITTDLLCAMLYDKRQGHALMRTWNVEATTINPLVRVAGGRIGWRVVFPLLNESKLCLTGEKLKWYGTDIS